jgi:hypothetical protein
MWACTGVWLCAALAAREKSFGDLGDATVSDADVPDSVQPRRAGSMTRPEAMTRS